MSPGISESECRSVDDDHSRTENSPEDEKDEAGEEEVVVVEEVVVEEESPPSGYEIKIDSESGEKYFINIFTGFL